MMEDCIEQEYIAENDCVMHYTTRIYCCKSLCDALHKKKYLLFVSKVYVVLKNQQTLQQAKIGRDPTGRYEL